MDYFSRLQAMTVLETEGYLGAQSWVFTGRTDAEAEAPVL